MNLPDGWLAESQAVYLAQLVKDVARLDGSFLEVGSWHGRSSVAIGIEVKKLNSRLYCVDIWNKKMTGKEEIERKKIINKYRMMPVVATKYFKGNSFLIFTKNIKARDLDDTIIPIIGLSSTIRKAWKIPLKFIFIDGNHEYRYVRDDSLWRRFLVKGGIITFHDYRRSGVKRPVDEEMNNDLNFEVAGSVRSLKTFRKLK